MEKLKIGEVSEHTGITKQAIRFYEREGLIEEPYRDPKSRYRKFDTEVLHRIRFIQNAKELGFTLDEIKELLSILKKNNNAPKKFAKKLSAKKNRIEEKIEKLQAIRDLLADMLERCPEEGTSEDCPCIQEIAPEGHLKDFLKPFEELRR